MLTRSKKNNIWKISAPILSIGASISIGIALIHSYVVQYAENWKHTFSNTIQVELDQRDTFQIARKLQVLEDSESISCVRLFFEQNLIYSSQQPTCSTSFWSKEISIQPNSQVKVTAVIGLPQEMRVLGIGFILVQIAILVYLTIQSYVIVKSEKRSAQKLRDLSIQVAHDIRSPLSALNMIIKMLQRDISDDKSLILQKATSRINDIANDLLGKGSLADTKPITLLAEPIGIYSLLSSAVNEAQTIYGDRANLTFKLELSQTYGLYSDASSADLLRVLSNLINNAVDSIDNGPGEVRLSAAPLSNGYFRIEISDNGKGIPPHILSRLGERGLSAGKDGTPNGSGVGFFHAKSTIESLKGVIKVASKERSTNEISNGTWITIDLPCSLPPRWLLSELVLPSQGRLICIDDDASIQFVWRNRLSHLASDLTHEFLSFNSPTDFQEWFLQDSLPTDQHLIDLDFKNETITGFKLIQSLGIKNRSIIVTSKHDDPAVKSLALDLSLKIIPKELIAYIPIKMEPREPTKIDVRKAQF